MIRPNPDTSSRVRESLSSCTPALCSHIFGKGEAWSFISTRFFKHKGLFTTKNTKTHCLYFEPLEKALCRRRSVRCKDILGYALCMDGSFRDSELGSIGIGLVPGVRMLYLKLNIFTNPFSIFLISGRFQPE